MGGKAAQAGCASPGERNKSTSEVIENKRSDTKIGAVGHGEKYQSPNGGEAAKTRGAKSSSPAAAETIDSPDQITS